MPATATGIFHTDYAHELRLRHTRAERARLVLALVLLLALPSLLGSYWLAVVNQIAIAAIGAVGLNILVGFTGQISLGHAGFMAIGAFSSSLLAVRAGLPMPLAMAGAVLLSAGLGATVGLCALRIEGAYLAIATLASQQLIEFGICRWGWLTAGQGFIDVPRLGLFGEHVSRLSFERTWYCVLATLAVLATLGARNLFRTALGRSLMAVRDHDIAAATLGVNVPRAKLTAFALSSGYAGLTGALLAHYTEIVTWERFTLDVSVQYLGMVIVGGLGSISGSIYGAVFISALPPLIAALARLTSGAGQGLTAQLPALQLATFGAVIVLFLLFEPRGLAWLWRRAKDYFEHWPFATKGQ